MEDINKEAREIELGIEASRKGSDYAVYLKSEASKHYIYSKYNPRQTARELIDLENVNEETIWIIFGMGLGYVAEEILNVAGTNSKIILIEPTKALAEQQKPYMDSLLQQKNINVFCGEDYKQLSKILEDVIKVKDINNIKVIVQPVYRNYFKSYYQAILKVVGEYIEQLKITYNTLKAFSYMSLENLVKNGESIVTSYDMTKMQGVYKNIPAVIVSAGPSLNKNVEVLKDFKGVIFTGTRSLPTIKKVGVEPDFLVCVDPNEIAYDIMREYGENEVNLIATEEASPQVVKNTKGKKFFVQGIANGLSKEVYGEDIMQLPLYGSVATLCLSAAHFMGCNPIIFIGQDLAFTGSKAHADNYQSHDVDLKDKHVRYVESIDGEMIPTDVKLLSFLRWIETFIEEHSHDTQYINCTEGGANIRGAQSASFRETIAAYNDNYAKEVVISKHKVRSTLAAKEKLIANLKQYIEVCKQGIYYTNAVYEIYQKGIDTHKVEKLTNLLAQEVSTKIKEMNAFIDMIFTIERLKVEVDLQYKLKCTDTQEEKDMKSIKKLLDIYVNTYEALQKMIKMIEEI